MATPVPRIDATSIITQAMRLPGVKISREDFLYKQLKNRYPYSVIRKAIDMNPAAAGIDRETIEKLAVSSIKYETAKVSAISAAAGIPGGWAMLGTVPADLTQYFGFILRILQKLAYLYGFDEFELEADDIDDDTMNLILTFLGVMFNVTQANVAVNKLAQIIAKRIAEQLPKQALTKGIVYPFIKTITSRLGIYMTKEVFAGGVAKAVPVVGGATNGGLTYITFRLCSNRLKNKFKALPISDPNYYKSILEEQ